MTRDEINRAWLETTSKPPVFGPDAMVNRREAARWAERLRHLAWVWPSDLPPPIEPPAGGPTTLPNLWPPDLMAEPKETP